MHKCLPFGYLIGFIFLQINSTQAQYNSIDWSSYLTDKNVKMVDSELVEYAIVSNESGKDNVYITGFTRSTSAQNSFCSTTLGNGDCFLAKYNSAGKMLWIKYFGGPGTENDSSLTSKYDWAYCLAIDKSPNGKPRIYVGGTVLKSATTITCSQASCTEDVYQSQPGDGWDGFIAKFDGDGNMLRWTYFGGGEAEARDTDEVLSLSVYNHQVYAAGYTESRQNSLLQPSKVASSYDTTYNGFGDGFIAVFDTCLSSLQFFSYYNTNADLTDSAGGPIGQDRVHCIKVGSDGAIYTTGTTTSASGFSRNSESSYKGSTDAFAGKWAKDSAGTFTPVWNTYIGGSQLERGRQLVLDDYGNIFCDGITRSDSTTFHATPNAIQRNSGGDADGYIAKLDQDGKIKWLTYLGSTNQDVLNGIQLVKPSYDTYIAVAGLTVNCDFFSSKSYSSPVLNILNGDTITPCPNYDTATLKRDAFVIMLSDPDHSADSLMHIYYGSFLGGSKNEMLGPMVTFSGYGPYLAIAGNKDLYITFSTTSKDVADASHGHAKKLKGKFHGKTDAILMKMTHPVSGGKNFTEVLTEPLVNTHVMEVYPQPCATDITLIIHDDDSQQGEVRILNSMGKYVRSFTVSTQFDKSILLDVHDLSSGTYFIQYISNEKHDVIKLVKQ